MSHSVSRPPGRAPIIAGVILGAAIVSFSTACSNAHIESHQEPVASAAFRSFVDDYFTELYRFNPTLGTSNGFHEYDDKLEDWSADAYRKRLEIVKSQLARVQALHTPKSPLSADEAIDASILEGQLRSEILDIETLNTYRRNPINYVSMPGSAIDLILKRNFAVPAERLRSIIARLRQVDPLLRHMRENVTEPPKEFTDLAVRISKGSVGFFRDTVAAWAKDAAGNDAALFNDFQTANRSVITAFETTTRYLEGDLKPKSKGLYAIGRTNFMNKLLYEEMVDIPYERLLAIGEANLEKDYRDFVATARKIDSSKSAAAVFASLANDHPTEKDLIPFAKQTVEGIRQFIVEHKIVTIPSDVRPIVTETPPYARSGTFASMDTPGAYEKVAKEAFYYITPPEKEWTPKHKEEHLRLYNRPVMDIITVHEAYPGHFVQFLYAKQFPTKTRKLIACGSNAEGWAHYSEQMMVEEGFANGDPKIRLAQLSEALLRDCRYVVGIKLHTRNMTVEQGARVFVERGFQEPANAFEESRRGAYNPTYLYYTLGKLQIYKLRADYEKAKGDAFSLQEFHDNFVKQGGIPIKLMRQVLLPGDTAPTL
jgi:uncharacterized protein (DUF885 family)